MKNVNGVKVGFIGMTLEGTDQIVAQAGIAGVEFLDEVETANRYVAALQRQKVESIVVLLHEGWVQPFDPTFQNSLCKDCDKFNGPIVDVVNGFDDAIDVVVSGHTHQAYNCEGSEAIDDKFVTRRRPWGASSATCG